MMVVPLLDIPKGGGKKKKKEDDPLIKMGKMCVHNPWSNLSI